MKNKALIESTSFAAKEAELKKAQSVAEAQCRNSKKLTKSILAQTNVHSSSKTFDSDRIKEGNKYFAKIAANPDKDFVSKAVETSRVDFENQV